jgi:hypothetical protein
MMRPAEDVARDRAILEHMREPQGTRHLRHGERVQVLTVNGWRAAAIDGPLGAVKTHVRFDGDQFPTHMPTGTKVELESTPHWLYR